MDYWNGPLISFLYFAAVLDFWDKLLKLFLCSESFSISTSHAGSVLDPWPAFGAPLHQAMCLPTGSSSAAPASILTQLCLLPSPSTGGLLCFPTCLCLVMYFLAWLTSFLSDKAFVTHPGRIPFHLLQDFVHNPLFPAPAPGFPRQSAVCDSLSLLLALRLLRGIFAFSGSKV